VLPITVTGQINNPKKESQNHNNIFIFIENDKFFGPVYMYICAVLRKLKP